MTLYLLCLAHLGVVVGVARAAAGQSEHTPTAAQELVIIGLRHAQVALVLGRAAGEELVEDVEGAFACTGRDDAGFLEQVVGDLATHRRAAEELCGAGGGGGRYEGEDEDGVGGGGGVVVGNGDGDGCVGVEMGVGMGMGMRVGLRMGG